jgi:serine/threonine protein kinase
MESRTDGPPSLIGMSIGGYRLERMLGKGATGAVFLGTRLDDSPSTSGRTQPVPVTLPDEAAIKILILPWQLDEDGRADFKARFIREAQTLQRLQHPHIVSILDHGEDPVTGHLYMVLPYLAGGTLATRPGTERLPLDDIDRTITQVAEALDYAHSQEVVHRDVKPSNILLDSQHQAYVGDFSIARILADTYTRLTSTGRIMGTPEYMAPEQIEGRDVQAAADIYSLGMVVYRLVTGRVAFIATSIVELIRLQTQEPPPPPRALRPDLPEPAEAAILCALEKDPGRRFNSAVAFAHAFSLGLQGKWAEELAPFLAVHAGLSRGDTTAKASPDANAITEPSGPIGSAPLRQRRLSLALVSAALVLLVACVAFVFANPSNPMSAVFAQLSSHASVGAPDSGKRTDPTQAQSTSTTGSHPSGSGGGSSGGGGGSGNQPTTTSRGTATVVGAPTATVVGAPTATAAPHAPTATATHAPAPTPTNTPLPQYYETTSGAGSGTFTNYTNAGGTVGPRINPYTTVQVTCRLTGFAVADGNTWWYLIAQSPWNNQYYASADNFYNNGQTSGPPNSIFVDTNVPLC